MTPNAKMTRAVLKGAKKSGRVKFRAAPSPAVEGPALKAGTVVFIDPYVETKSGILYRHVWTTDFCLSGWVEDSSLAK